MSAEVRAPDYLRRPVNPERLAAIERHAGASVLDVGCGNGAYVLQLAGRYDIHGVDLAAYDTWRELPHRFRTCDAAELPFADESFDTLVSFETLEHVPQPERALREFHRVCRKNVIITVPNCELSPGLEQSRLIYYHWIDPTHVNFFDLEKLERLFGESGFRVVERSLINQITLRPLFEEALDLSGWRGALLRRLIGRRERQAYRMTCLLVAEKR